MTRSFFLDRQMTRRLKTLTMCLVGVIWSGKKGRKRRWGGSSLISIIWLRWKYEKERLNSVLPFVGLVWTVQNFFLLYWAEKRRGEGVCIFYFSILAQLTCVRETWDEMMMIGRGLGCATPLKLLCGSSPLLFIYLFSNQHF